VGCEPTPGRTFVDREMWTLGFRVSRFDLADYVSGFEFYLHRASDADVRPVHEVPREERAHDCRSHLPCGVGFKNNISQQVFEKTIAQLNSRTNPSTYPLFQQ